MSRFEGQGKLRTSFSAYSDWNNLEPFNPIDALNTIRVSRAYQYSYSDTTMAEVPERRSSITSEELNQNVTNPLPKQTDSIEAFIGDGD